MKDVVEGVRSLGISPLREAEAQTVLDGIARNHVAESDAIYWWANLKTISELINYGGGDGVTLLARALGYTGNQHVFLVVTDDEPLPWPVFRIRCDQLMPLLKALPFFEYFVASENLQRVVFDTHENKLFVSLAGGA